MLTRISDEEITKAFRVTSYRWDAFGHKHITETYNPHKVAQAQLDHCQKELDAMTVPPEVLEATIQLRIGEKVKEIFEETELIILRELNQNLNNYPWWQALKERFGQALLKLIKPKG